MKRYSAPITEENFDFSSDHILKKCRKSIGRRRAYKVVVPVSTALFMFLSLIFSYGAIFSISTAEDAIVFEKLKPITAIWQFFADLLVQEGAKWYINVPIFVAALLLVPMAISIILSVIFKLTSKKPDLPAEAISAKEKAKALHEIIESSHHSSEIDYGVVALVNAGVYIALMVAFTVFSMILTFDFSQLDDLISLIFGAVVVFSVLYFVHAYLYMMYYFMNVCTCGLKSIFKYKTDVYDFWCSIDPEEAENREKKKKEEEAKKAAAERDRLSLYKDTAYYRERVAEAKRNIDKYAYGYSYPDYVMRGTHFEDKEALTQFLQSNAPYDVKQAAIRKFNDHYLDNFTG